ncbi:PhyH-domain-containing protein [Martensiomyces pterosporus]|nr:PhyH-domain-containing protein [Martensiomyces pterosporus]
MVSDSYVLSAEQMKSYSEEGYIKITDMLQPDEIEKLVSSVREIQSWPDTPGKWMNYYEINKVTGQRQLCRTENFTPYHDYVRQVVTGKRIMDVLEQLSGEPYILFKEKINAKLPGGEGFLAHQDAPAFIHLGQVNHITVLFTVDGSYIENGCLYAVPGSHKSGKVLPQKPDGSISQEWCDAHEWVPVECNSGDILIFGSYLAHVSGKNKSNVSRANLYMTYNTVSEGDRREAYYADKRESFPPDYERVEGKDYSEGAKIYNLGNPIL